MKTATISNYENRYFQLSGISENYKRSLSRAKKHVTETHKNIEPIKYFINGLVKWGEDDE